MFTNLPMDDILAFSGLASLLAGIYLWLGLAATLILLGIILIYAGARLDLTGTQNEPDQTASSTVTQIQPRQR